MGAKNFLTASNEELERELEKKGTHVQFPAGHVLLFEGQPVHSAFILTHGHVAVSKQDKYDQEVVLAFRGPGEILGLTSIIDGQTQGEKVESVRNVEALMIPAQQLLQFITTHHLELNIVKHATDRLREADAERMRIARLSVKERFAHLLVELATEMGRPGDEGTVIDAALNQAALATRIGASREGVAMALRRLRDEGLILTGRRTITVRDVDRLRQAASREEV